MILLSEWTKKYPQVYLEECKYKMKKKIHLPRFINTELESDPDSDVETDLESNTSLSINCND